MESTSFYIIQKHSLSVNGFTKFATSTRILFYFFNFSHSQHRNLCTFLFFLLCSPLFLPFTHTYFVSVLKITAWDLD